MKNPRKIKIVSGFTLTELMVVVGIIIFLSMLAIFAFRGQIFKGRDARRKGDIHKIQVAVEEYEKDNNCYPLPSQLVCDPGTGLQPYLEKIPCDPTTDASYLYQIEESSCPDWYRLLANLENENDPDAQSACGPDGSYNYYSASPNAPFCNLTESSFYGCKTGVCVPIFWDNLRPGPECDPNYQNASCYGQCGPQANECQPWDQ
jgi:type II secretory pathway pseudopilin PulG